MDDETWIASSNTGLINQKNGLSQQSSEALSTQGLQPKYRFQNRQ